MPVLAASSGQSASQPPVRTVVRADAKTGRLVRTAIAPVAATSVPRPVPAQLTELVDRIAGQQGVEAPLVHSVILAESNYNAGAVSPKGAQGIMQLIPSTARRFGVGNVFDAADNIQGGVRYLRFLLDYYHGDYTKSIAAYNAGEAAVDKYHGVPPYAETLGYVRTVARHLTAARQNQANVSARTSIPASPASPAPTDTQPHIQAQTGADGLVYYRTP
jgi:soluble lytic murein transglycosylase-like protein